MIYPKELLRTFLEGGPLSKRKTCAGVVGSVTMAKMGVLHSGPTVAKMGVLRSGPTVAKMDVSRSGPAVVEERVVEVS